MNKNIMLMVALSGITITSVGEINKSKELIVQKALDNGGIIITSSEIVNITPDVMEILELISKSGEQFSEPILVFTKDKIEIKNRKKFEDILSKPGQTVTSL